ncbi:salicylate hydroxylase [Aspergillus bombycis]|uniref:Salicylate hydroxylase n=1 Tax=Aspergillus bombycis TaxID=109264 RepID=A0A1F7ZRD7_9EURO|nr:salicylate hydroxylase [Aspergillus bombycis]OGM42002.1 salicylate hydroxylase [Aspergillus bombycis]
MSEHRKAIIIGGGPAGLSTALRLHQTTNIKCSIYELRPEPTTLGGAIGIMPNGLRLFSRLGVYDALHARGSSRSNLIIHSAQGGIVGKQEDMVSYARAQTGFGYLRIKRTDLVDVLLDAVYQAQIPIYFNKRLTAIDDNGDSGVTVTFSDGSTDKADILVGCDGIHSCVRRLYVDPDQRPEYSGLSALSSLVPTSRLSSVAATQVSGIGATLTEQGMFMVMLATAAGDEVAWGLSQEVPLPDAGDSRDGWEVYRQKEVNGFKSNMHQILEKLHGDWGDLLRQLVENTDVMKFYPVYRLPLGGAWYKGRCVLLGDAAHAMQPHAGQGVSMALEDTFLLARLLEDPSRPVAEVYKKFDEIRRPRVNEIYNLAAQNAGVRKTTGPWGLWSKEVMVGMAFWASWALGLEKRGWGQKHMAYDIDAEEI